MNTQEITSGLHTVSAVNTQATVSVKQPVQNGNTSNYQRVADSTQRLHKELPVCSSHHLQQKQLPMGNGHCSEYKSNCQL